MIPPAAVTVEPADVGVTEARPPAGTGRPRPTAFDWILVVGICLFGAFAAMMAFFYLPWYAGSVPLPVSVLGVGVLCWLLPRTAHRLTGSMWAAVAPAVVMFGVILFFLFIPNQLDLQRPPRVIDDPPFEGGVADGTSWRNMLLLGVPALASAASLALVWADRVAGRNVTAVTSGAPDAGATDDSGHTGTT